NDVRTMSPATRAILLNPEVIAVDQDSLGVQGTLVAEPAPTLQVWMKPLAGGARAVVLLNRSELQTVITAPFWRLRLPPGPASAPPSPPTAWSCFASHRPGSDARPGRRGRDREAFRVSSMTLDPPRAYRALAIWFAACSAVCTFGALRAHWAKSVDFDVIGFL